MLFCTHVLYILTEHDAGTTKREERGMRKVASGKWQVAEGKERGNGV
jgi:hypothetical protein